MEPMPLIFLCALQTTSPQNPSPILFCRLRQLDKHGQATAQQLVQLLNKQNQLLLERQNLSEEVDRLRAQVGCEDTWDTSCTKYQVFSAEWEYTQGPVQAKFRAAKDHERAHKVHCSSRIGRHTGALSSPVTGLNPC